MHYQHTTHNRNTLPFFFTLAILSGILFFSACNDNSFSTNPAYKLSFSADTVSFDTVFTNIGSATTIMKVYNPNKEKVKISSIALEKGGVSSFRVNVDGAAGSDNRFFDMEINAKDSLFIFISVKINPNNASSPVIEEDAIKFITNGNEQKVRLEAYGQDVEILRNHIIYSDSTLTADKPYLIYGYLAVDSARTLTLPAGCRLYFYNEAYMIVYGNLHALGTHEQPITMRGHRRDNISFIPPVPYNYIAGQWDGIYLYGKEGKHIFRHVNMNSGSIGIHLLEEDMNSPKRPKLEVTNCRVHNFMYYGLVAQNSDITVINTEISNAGVHCVYLNGGKHSFIHCTISNYFSGGYQPVSRKGGPSVMIMDLGRIAPMETYFYNSVVMGNVENEFGLVTQFPKQYKGAFTHSYIRQKQDTAEVAQYSNIRWYERNDTVFRQPYYDIEEQTYFDFIPDSVSPLRGLADPEITTRYKLEIDLRGNHRMIDGRPDAGAYQWQESLSAPL